MLRRDALLLRESPWALVLSLASMVLGVVVFGLLGRFVGQGTDYITFVVTGITFLRVIDAVVQAPGASMRDERSRGSLEMLVDAPQPPWALIAAAGLIPAARSLVEGTSALVLAAALFRTSLAPGWPGLFIVPLTVAAVMALAIATGVFFAGAGMQSRAATAASTFFGLAVALTAQVYYPRSSLPTWLAVPSKYSPFTEALRSLRAALTGRGSPWFSLLVTGSAALLIFVAGAALTNRAVRLSRTSGAFARG